MVEGYYRDFGMFFVVERVTSTTKTIPKTPVVMVEGYYRGFGMFFVVERD